MENLKDRLKLLRENNNIVECDDSFFDDQDDDFDSIIGESAYDILSINTEVTSILEAASVQELTLESLLQEAADVNESQDAKAAKKYVGDLSAKLKAVQDSKDAKSALKEVRLANASMHTLKVSIWLTVLLSPLLGIIYYFIKQNSVKTMNSDEKKEWLNEAKKFRDNLNKGLDAAKKADSPKAVKRYSKLIKKLNNIIANWG